MKRATKAKARRDATRDLFAELSEGMKALADERCEKRTLRLMLVDYRETIRKPCH